MRHSACRFLAVSSAAFVLATARAATRPHYGGTLRVEIQARVSTLDPVEWPDIPEADAVLKFRDLIYDRLVRLDLNGRPQPSIALSWEHDAEATTWRFKLRPRVVWQDSSQLTYMEVLSALEGVAPGASVRLIGDTLEINMGRPRPDLLVTLATEPGLWIRRPAVPAADSLPLGTGPFRLTDWQPGRSAVLQANDDYWDGRPYIDKIEVQMGRSSRDQLLDMQLDRADVFELDPSEARRAQQEGKRVWSSSAVELLYLRFDLNKPAVRDRRLREAVVDSIDRSAIQKVLVQNYGEVAGGIFPQWLSGYSFLFSTAINLNRARQLGAEMGTWPTLKLGYDSNDGLARQSAERVAVNARDAGITLQVSPLPQGWWRMPDTGTDIRLQRVRIDGPTLDQAAIEAASRLGFSSGGEFENPERNYGQEQEFLASLTVVPLVYVSELAGVGPRVKDWLPLPWGGWRLQDVWLQVEDPERSRRAEKP